MDLKRLIRHLLSSRWQARRAFPEASLAAIEASIRAAEQTHAGEIRFALEATLEPWALLRGQTPRERAVELFSSLRVWDTQHNNGVLIYVLLADHAVEIVVDRGIHGRESEDSWRAICHQLETSFKRADYKFGALAGIDSVGRILRRHFPREGGDANELPDEPLLL